MAKLFLTPADNHYRIGNDNTRIFGAYNAQTIIFDSGLKNIELDSNVEAIEFNLPANNFLFLQTGNLLNIYDSANTLIAEFSIQDDDDGSQLQFFHGSVDTKFTANANMAMGYEAVSTSIPQPILPSIYKLDISQDKTAFISYGNDKLDFSNELADFVVMSLAGDDEILTGSGVDIIYAGAGKDRIHAGAGDDIIVVIGQTTANQYSQLAITNPGNSGIDLSRVIPLSELNDKNFSDVVAGEYIDGGAGENTLVIYGTIDFAAVTLANIAKLQINSNVTISSQQLNNLGLNALNGDSGSVLNITNEGNTPIVVDLSKITLNNFHTLNLGTGITLIADQEDVNSLKAILGKGTIKASEKSGVLDLSGKTIGVMVEKFLIDPPVKPVVPEPIPTPPVVLPTPPVVETPVYEEPVYSSPSPAPTPPEPPTPPVLTYTIAGNLVTGSAQADNIDLNANTDDLIVVGLAGDDSIATGEGDDIIRSGDGKDSVFANAGNDLIVVIGQTAANQYVLSDIYNPGGSGIDLSDVISLSDLNNRAISEVVAGEIYDGGAGINRLVIYGNVDLTGVTLLNVSQFQVNSTVTISATQLSALNLSFIFGDGQSVLNIVQSDTPITVDLTNLSFESFSTLNIGANVTVIMDQADVDSLRILSGEGIVKASTVTGTLNLAGKQINVVVQDKDGNVDATHGGGIYVEGKLLIGTEAPETLTGAEKADRLEGSAGNDSLVGGDGNDTLRGGAGVDTMDGGAGDDTFVIVGDISGGGKVDSVADTAALGFALTTLNGKNLNEDEDGAVEVIRGGDGVDTLYVYGAADLSNYDITGVEHIEIRSNVIFNANQLQNIQSLRGDGHSTVGIVSSSAAQLELANIAFSQLGQLSVGENVTLIIPNVSVLGGVSTLSGTGSIRGNSNTPLDLSGITQVSTLDIRNSDNSLAQGGIKTDNVILGEANEEDIVGTEGNDVIFGSNYDDIIVGGDGADYLHGRDGDDILCGDERFIEFLDPEAFENPTENPTPEEANVIIMSKALVNNLGGESGFGENVLVPNDDESSAAIDITAVFGEAGINFFGRPFTSLYVNNNGNITFAGTSGTYTPNVINAGIDNPIIAAFWADVDTRGNAPNPPSVGGNSTGSNRVWYDLDTDKGIFTATWDDVGYYGNHSDKLNAFQIQLINKGEGNFDIVYRYENVDWVTGDASGGTDGLGGSVARAGYSAGNEEGYFEMTQSGNQDAMLALESTKQYADTPEGVFKFTVWNGHAHVHSNNDTLVGGAGNDTILGGVGVHDVAVYHGARSDYTISVVDTIVFISDNVADRDGDDVVMPSVEYLKFSDGEIATSTLSPKLVDPIKLDFIENLIGTDFNDELTGNSLDNYLDGGWDGNDTLTGLEGDDILYGDWGDDTAVYRGNMADYTIEEYFDEDYWEVFWVVIDNNTADGDDGFDLLYSIEFLQFADVPKYELPVTDLSNPFSVFVI